MQGADIHPARIITHAGKNDNYFQSKEGLAKDEVSKPHVPSSALTQLS
jgi:hypothetical protein